MVCIMPKTWVPIMRYYCKAEAGFVISRALLISVMPEMPKCLTGINVAKADEWLGRCLLTLTKVVIFLGQPILVKTIPV